MVDSIKIEIKLTVEQMSKTFASMGCEEQASFFSQAWEHLEKSCGDEVYREQQCSFIREALAKQPEAQAFLAALREPETDRKNIALEYRQWDLADSTPLEDVRENKMEMANCHCVPDPIKSLGKLGTNTWPRYSAVEARILARQENPNVIELKEVNTRKPYFADSRDIDSAVFFYGADTSGPCKVVIGKILRSPVIKGWDKSVLIGLFGGGETILHNVESLQRLCCDTPEGATHKHDCTRKCAYCGSFACVEHGNDMCINSTVESKEYNPGHCYVNPEAFDSGSLMRGPDTKWKILDSVENGSVCPDCDGTGEVELLTSFVECERCQKGTLKP